MPKKATKKTTKSRQSRGSSPKAGKATSACDCSSSKVKLGKLVGEVTHYFSEIGVAVLKIASPIKEGDEIRLIGGENTDFTQGVSSMQIDHEKVKTAKKGDDVGLKVKEKE